MIRLALICLAAAALALSSAPVAAAQWAGDNQRQAAASVSLDDLSHTTWIADGRDDAPRKVYVFLDANCIYCAKFWADARPWVDSGKVQLRYLLVAVIAPTSGGKAATLLADPDPAARLAAYERAHAFGVERMLRGGPHASMQDASLMPTPVSGDVAHALAANEGLLNAFNLRGTPGLVFRGLDGRPVAIGGIPADGLEGVFGAR